MATARAEGHYGSEGSRGERKRVTDKRRNRQITQNKEGWEEERRGG